jgi:hypothetical protein
MSIAHEQRQQSSPLVIQTYLTQVLIIGDLRLSVTESEAANGPSSGVGCRLILPQTCDYRSKGAIPFHLWGGV